MTLTDEATRLRNEITRHTNEHGRKFSPEMRSSILGWVERARQEGLSVVEAGRRIGIPSPQLHGWLTASRRLRKNLALVPVEVAKPRSVNTAQVSLVAPSGFRIEGLTIEQALEALRVLQ
jgi:hypothetical protein